MYPSIRMAQKVFSAARTRPFTRVQVRMGPPTRSYMLACLLFTCQPKIIHISTTMSDRTCQFSYARSAGAQQRAQRSKIAAAWLKEIVNLCMHYRKLSRMCIKRTEVLVGPQRWEMAMKVDAERVGERRKRRRPRMRAPVRVHTRREFQAFQLSKGVRR